MMEVRGANQGYRDRKREKIVTKGKQGEATPFVKPHIERNLLLYNHRCEKKETEKIPTGEGGRRQKGGKKRLKAPWRGYTKFREKKPAT